MKIPERSIESQTLSGFGNTFESEAVAGALPIGQNNPQKCNFGLYAEQLSGSPFTSPRTSNQRTWMYRIQPSVSRLGQYVQLPVSHWQTACHEQRIRPTPSPLRWGPIPEPSAGVNFVDGLKTMTVCGDALARSGMASHAYAFTKDMRDEYLSNADGEMLILPQQSELRVDTELGTLEVAPGELVVIPRGIVFRIGRRHNDGICARGYVCENYGANFLLPDLGPIGANGLANPRDFVSPVAAFEDRAVSCLIYTRWCGRLYMTKAGYSPLDVVAWHGNYVPYKYDLNRFSPVGSIAKDHPDPSIFTVLTSPTPEAGSANVDFVIFPPRWMVAENTFRPPWFHRNVMSEFMGLIQGVYDAKDGGFVPGGMSLHNLMQPHGPDASTVLKAESADLNPAKIENSLAFMFESRQPQQITDYAAELESLEVNYIDCWKNIPRRFGMAE